MSSDGIIDNEISAQQFSGDGLTDDQMSGDNPMTFSNL